MPSRAAKSRYADAIVVVVAELGLLGFFWWSGRIFGAPPLLHMAGWFSGASPERAFTALFRLVGLITCAWLVLGTAVYILSRILYGARHVKAARWMALPLVRRALDTALAASIVAGGVGGSAVAAFASPPPAVAHPFPPGNGGPGGSGALSEGRVSAGPQATISPTGHAHVPINASEKVEVDQYKLGRHIPHPGIVRHTVPPRPAHALDAPVAVNAAPGPDNVFLGLAPGTKVVIVQPGDCLSVIAQRHLGDWRLDSEIERLNQGRLQPDGQSLEDDHWIFPGWVLVMPADAVGTAVVGGAPGQGVSVGTSAANGVPGGEITGSAQTSALVRSAPERPSAPTTVPTTTVPTTTVPTTTVPTTTVPASGVVDSPHPVGPAARTPGRGPVHGSTEVAPSWTGNDQMRPAIAQGPDHPPAARALDPDISAVVAAGPSSRPTAAPTIGGLGAMAASSVLWRIDKGRRQRMHERPKGRVLVKDRIEVRQAEAAARAMKGDEALRWADCGLRYLGALVEQLVRARASGVPDLVCARVGAEGFEVLLDPLPQGSLGWFSPSTSGWLRLEPEITLDELAVLAEDRWPVWPAVICVGQEGSEAEMPDKGTVLSQPTVLFNVEFAGALVVDGETSMQQAMLEAWLLELASHPWCHEMLSGVYSIGQDVATATSVSGDEAMAVIERLDAVSDANQSIAGNLSMAAIRSMACEALPNVVAVFPASESRAADCISEAAAPRKSGVCALVAGPANPTSWRLVLGSDGRGCLEGPTSTGPVSVRVKSSVDREASRLLSEALVSAFTEGGFVSPDNDVTQGSERSVPEGTGLNEASYLSCDHGAVEVRVLGQLEVVGEGTGDLDASRRAAALSLLAYLACHRRPVTVEELSSALWPLDGGAAKLAGPQRKTVMNVISRARTLIGYGAKGQERIIYSSEGYYLAPDVTCDIDRFRVLVRRAGLADPPEAVRYLEQALSLVRGEPFAGSAASQFFEWAISEHLDLEATALVLDAAEALGRAALESGQFHLAITAARTGLGLDPIREQLCCIWMEAAGRKGDLAEVDQVFRRLSQLLRQRLHPLQEPADGTRRVWASYCRKDLAGSSTGPPGSPWAF